MKTLPPLSLRRGLVAAGCAAAALALSPAVAAADSIVFVKDANVWLANADGSGQYQVTSDGTAEHPYRSPSQADDGTIAAGYGEQILRLRQNGEVLNRLDPPMLINSVSHPMDGVPVDVAISPDGTKVAYSFYGYECPVGASCGARTTTGIIPSDRFAATPEFGESYFRNPSWVTDGRILNSGGYGSHVNIQDLGAEPFNWVTDHATDLGDAEVTRQGDKLVAIRGYSDSTHVVWYRVDGNVKSGPKPPLPEAICATGEQAGFDQPTWAPDGNQVAWTEPDGIWIHRDAAGCESRQPTLVLPGGSEADWGPANVAPGPRTPAGGGGSGGGGGSTVGGGSTGSAGGSTGGAGGSTGGAGGSTGGGSQAAPLALTLKASGGSKLRVRGKRVKLALSCPTACRYDAKLTLDARTAKRLRLGRTLARTTGTAKAGRPAVITFKLSAREARALKKLAKRSPALRATVSATAGTQSGRQSAVVAPR